MISFSGNLALYVQEIDVAHSVGHLCAYLLFICLSVFISLVYEHVLMNKMVESDN